MSRSRIPGVQPEAERALLERFERIERRFTAVEKQPPEPAVITDDFFAREGQTLIVAAPSAGINGILPTPRAQNRGAKIVLGFTTTGAVTLSCPDGTVNGAATLTSSLVGAYVAVCDGSDGWLVLPVTAGSTSITIVGGQIRRAALTGAITAAANSNTTAFGAAAARSVLVNATNASAVPAFLAAANPLQYLRETAAGTGLEWALQGTVATKTSLVTVTNATTPNLLTPSGFSIPANTLVAGSKVRYVAFFTFTRGATATALNLLCAATIGANSVVATVATATTASFTGFGLMFADLTVLTTGAGGTGMLTVRVLNDCGAGSALAVASAENTAIAVNTTTALTAQGNIAMSAAVANTTLTVTSGDVAVPF